MPIATQKIMPCLWFDTQGEAAAKHYVSIFKNSKKFSASAAMARKARKSTGKRQARS